MSTNDQNSSFTEVLSSEVFEVEPQKPWKFETEGLKLSEDSAPGPNPWKPGASGPGLLEGQKLEEYRSDIGRSPSGPRLSFYRSIVRTATRARSILVGIYNIVTLFLFGVYLRMLRVGVAKPLANGGWLIPYYCRGVKYYQIIRKPRTRNINTYIDVTGVKLTDTNKEISEDIDPSIIKSFEGPYGDFSSGLVTPAIMGYIRLNIRTLTEIHVFEADTPIVIPKS